ncbi:hypothetical protein ACSSS7_002915 [Eimeria intestinalis]
MEHYFAVETPQEASGSTSTAAVDADDARPNGSDNSQTATGDSIPAESNSIPGEDQASDESNSANAVSGGAADPRFRLGIETGRWFAGSAGDVYELLDSVGSGSASTVYKCKKVRISQVAKASDFQPSAEASRFQQREDELLAVKAIDLKGLRLNRNFTHEMEKVRKEAQYLRTLRHPGIVRFIDYVETSDAIFIVQEYLKGGELFYKIVEKGCLSEQQACFIAHQMLAAIVYMHNSKIIHRDIKPENILIHDEVEDGFFRVKLADFGLAKTLANCGTMATTMVGTPQYWAPEVIACGGSNAHGSYGYGADLWSFGVCLYVFLGGTYPFDGATGPIQQLVLNGQFHFRHSRFSRVSDDAKDLIRRALVVDQARRITEKEVGEQQKARIFFHPWMTRWLCDFDRSRFRLPDSSFSAFRFMPPLPPLAPPNATYPPSSWHAETQQTPGRTPVVVSPSSVTIDHGVEAEACSTRGESETIGRMKGSSIGAMELRADSPDAAGVAVGAMLPGFVKTNQPIPPFHLPILLPLQLHLLLSVHLLMLSLRESQSSFLLAQKLQKELWSLQRCVHTAVGFFEVTATSAIEAVTDIMAMFDGGEEREDPAGAAEAIGELFAQVRRWTCEMQQQGERLGVRYGRSEASVSDLICCVLAAVSTPDPSPAQQEVSKELLCASHIMGGAATAEPGRPKGKASDLTYLQQPVSEPTSVTKAPPAGHKRALLSPESASQDNGTAVDSEGVECGIGLWGAGGSVARMDMLREFLASNIRRMLYSFGQPSREDVEGENSPSASEDRKLVDAGVRAWSQVGMLDPSVVTEEILDFLFLSTKTAASHARQMRQQPEKPGECFSVNGEGGASGKSSARDHSPCPQDVYTPRGEQQQNHVEPSALSGHKEQADASELPSRASSREEHSTCWAKRDKGGFDNSNPDCTELSFLCEADAHADSSKTALQHKIAVSRLQLRSLEKLRQISYVLTCVCSFWSNFDVILCRLLQLQQITETLTKHARATWINKRAHKRLGHLRNCWVKFRTQCRIYLELSNARNAKLMDLGLHVQMRADQLDAIRALHGVPEE